MARLFLSSRFNGFGPMRALLRKALTDEGFDVVDLQDRQAASVSPVKRSLDALDQCDAMVLMLDATYGESGVTEKEFDYAISRGIPVYAFSRPLGDAADERARTFRNRVREDLTVGTLAPPDADADRDLETIIATLLLGFGGEDDRETPTDRLLRDLVQLGLEGLADFKPSEFQYPKTVATLEDRTLAAGALERGAGNEAWAYLNQDRHDKVPDWASAFLAARLAASRRHPSEMRRAVEELNRGVNEIRRWELAPLGRIRGRTYTDTDELERRAYEERSAASQVVLAQLNRELATCEAEAKAEVHWKAAFTHAGEALNHVSHSEDALVERVLAAAGLGDAHALEESFGRLLDRYPDAAVRAAALIPDPTTSHGLAEWGAEKIEQRHSRLERELGVARKPGRHASNPLLHALRSYRATAAAARDQIGAQLAHVVQTAGQPEDRVIAAAAQVRAAEAQLVERATRAREWQATWDRQVRLWELGDLAADAAPAWAAQERHRLTPVAQQGVGAAPVQVPPVPTLRAVLRSLIGIAVLWLVARMVALMAHMTARGMTIVDDIGWAAATLVALVCAGRYANVLRQQRRARAQAVRAAAAAEATARLDGVSRLEALAQQVCAARDAVPGAAAVVDRARSALVDVRCQAADAAVTVGLAPCPDSWALVQAVAERMRAYTAITIERPRWADRFVRSTQARGGESPRFLRKRVDGGGLLRGDERRFVRPVEAGWSDIEYFVRGVSRTDEDLLYQRLDEGLVRERCPRCGCPTPQEGICSLCGQGAIPPIIPAGHGVVPQPAPVTPDLAASGGAARSLVLAAATVMLGLMSLSQISWTLPPGDLTKAPVASKDSAVSAAGETDRGAVLVTAACGRGVGRPLGNVGTGTKTTTCPFALNVRRAYVAAPHAGGGPVKVTAYSQALSRTIPMTCTGRDVVTCVGGDNAQVLLTDRPLSTP